MQNHEETLASVLLAQINLDPFNLVATVIFFCAITHTFFAPFFLRLSHRIQSKNGGGRGDNTFLVHLLHFLGEVEAIFGIWVVPLLIAMTFNRGWSATRNYLDHQVGFTEPLFVVVVMAIASSKPILYLADRILSRAASIGSGSVGAWWLAILTIAPLLGSLITEPAAMTIGALLLSRKVYSQNPSTRLAYMTLGLLFVNISIGGTLTHFAAPPVVMVASKWGWGIHEMITLFGWKALIAIVASNLCVWTFFRGELARLGGAKVADEASEAVPVMVVMSHLLFLAWTVATSHSPALFIGGFLFYIAYTEATHPHQDEMRLRAPLLVGFFLAGLVVHGGLQGWWIGPVLSRLSEFPLFFASVGLTAFNDNAAITYLASLVPNFNQDLRYIVVAGAVAGGGLTVIANAPNPAGLNILGKHFPEGVRASGLLAAALFPTMVSIGMFLIFR